MGREIANEEQLVRVWMDESRMKGGHKLTVLAMIYHDVSNEIYSNIIHRNGGHLIWGNESNQRNT